MKNYYNFADHIRFDGRFGLSDICREFLSELAVEAKERVFRLEAGQEYYRAQINSVDDYERISKYADPMAVPLKPERMIPDSRYVGDGRVSPKGIAY